MPSIRTFRSLLAVTGFAIASISSAAEKGSQRLTPAEFNKLHQLIKPHAGESRWMEIAWHPTVWEARQKAAAEGKPLFIWAGSGGAPAAGC